MGYVLQCLQSMPIFGGIQERILTLLVKRSAQIQRAAGQYFFREGSAGQSAFVLIEGTVAIEKLWQGEPQQLRRLGPGDCFGEVALVDFGPRSASVLAESACTAMELTARDLAEAARVDAEQFALLYMNIARELGRRLRSSDERLFRLAYGGEPVPDEHAFGAD